MNRMAQFLLLTTVAFACCAHTSNASDLQPSANTAVLPIKTGIFKLQQQQNIQQLSHEEKIDKNHKILDRTSSEYKKPMRQYQVAMSALPAITFYGRVIDQYGQPVKNATVWYEGTNTYFSAGGGRGVAKTDEDGYFEIETSGASLSLGGVTHPEIDSISYVPPNYENTTLSEKVSTISFVNGIDNQGVRGNWRDHTEKDKAYLIHAWRLGKYEGAVAGSINAFYDSSGKPYTLALRQGRMKQNEGTSNGLVVISCTRPHMESHRDYGDWNISIKPINGGIQENDDLYMNRAPEAGYQSSLNIVMHRDDVGYKQKILNKKYYFTSNIGKEYGSLFVHIEPFASKENDACAVFVDYKLNPTGSRNLELKHD